MADTKQPVEEQCIAIQVKDGKRCPKRGIYQDQGDVFCGTHYPYFMAKKRAVNAVRKEQKAAREIAERDEQYRKRKRAG